MARLSSRKFLLAVAAFISAGFAGEPWAQAVVAGIYVLAEGAIDVASS